MRKCSAASFGSGTARNCASRAISSFASVKPNSALGPLEAAGPCCAPAYSNTTKNTAPAAAVLFMKAPEREMGNEVTARSSFGGMQFLQHVEDIVIRRQFA